MGSSNSKIEKDEALRLCKERKRFMKQAIESRYGLAASHVSYVQSLRDIGVGLRRYAEAEGLMDSDKTPSHSSLPSPSPSHLNEVVSDSPLTHNLVTTNLNYMRSTGSTVTVSFNPVTAATTTTAATADYDFPIPMPPPPPPDSWDYFDPVDENDHSFSFAGTNGVDGPGHSRNEFEEIKSPEFGNSSSKSEGARSKKVVENEKEVVSGEREDPSEFISHRAKDFLSSIKDIEHRFFRASESGNEVSRMLEANKIRVGYSEAKEKSSALAFVQSLQVVCCHRDGSLISHEPSMQGKKVITWKRTTSSRSSSSRNPLAGDGNDSGSDFAEEFCMIAGSHSSTLDRLYAWERKLYDEVKASESIRKEFDQKCAKLRKMFAKDYSSHAIDKTRAVVKDLHSRIRVAIHSVDLISKRIEKMRDEELHPQLVELTHGLIRMWKSMLECHHAQYITISLAYHTKSSTGTTTPRGDSNNRVILEELLQQVECFGLSFADWINSLTSYVESLHSWLHNSILPPRERSKRRPFSPRRYVGPPIFTLCRDWTAEIRLLPSDELTCAIRAFLSDLQRKKAAAADVVAGGEDENSRDSSTSNLGSVQQTLTKVLDRLTKFSEASLKMYEDLKLKNEAARVAYSNGRSRF